MKSLFDFIRRTETIVLFDTSSLQNPRWKLARHWKLDDGKVCEIK
ncbi:MULTISPECIES: hypothetical protein [Mesobacillus]|nr:MULTISPECIES: hypothetical protein [Mesobacillus]